MSARRVLAFITTAILSCGAQELTIAGASDLQAALPAVVRAYEKKTGQTVRVSYGSSGNLFAQIQNGAPFDIFFSADVDYPKRLEAAGLSQKDSLYVYAIGQIVVWTPNESPLDLEHQGLKALSGPAVKRIAIANPAHAPYGRAAKAALEKAGIWEAVKHKIVLGENVSQAAQFVHTGNAEAGIIALALARSPRLQAEGKYWLVPQHLYPQLGQAAVVMKRAKDSRAAADFMAFLKSSAGAGVMQGFGFIRPVPGAKARGAL